MFPNEGVFFEVLDYLQFYAFFMCTKLVGPDRTSTNFSEPGRNKTFGVELAWAARLASLLTTNVVFLAFESIL
jgi:hypothetical protein